MSFNTFQEFNYDDLAWSKDSGFYGDDFGFNGQSWDRSNVAGPSQPYTGVDVFGHFNDYPDFPSPSATPTSSYPTNGVFPDEGYHSPFYQSAAVPSFPPQPVAAPSTPSIHHTLAATSPVPTLLYGSRSLSPELYGAPTTPTYHPYGQPQPVPNPDDLGFDLFTGAGSSFLPTVHHPPTIGPSYEELRGQFPQPAPLDLSAPAFDPVMAPGLSEISLPTPVASSSGPTRTRKSTREGRRYDPVKTAERAAAKKEGWDRTLTRFQSQLRKNLYNGQPSGGFIPAKALASVEELVKEDLKQSPLQDTQAASGKRGRNVEDYLKGLLGAIRRERSTPKPDASGSNEDDTSVAALSRLAGELEAELVAVNQQPTLRRALFTSRVGQGPGDEQAEGQVETGKSGNLAGKNKSEGRSKETDSKGRDRKRESEMVRRGAERHELERMCALFKAPGKGWTRREALSLVVLFRLYGPEAFPPGFVVVRPTTLGL